MIVILTKQFQSHLLHSLEWECDHEWWRGKDLEGGSLGIAESLSLHSLGGTGENHEKSQSV